jgi:hypothetical protein
LKSCVASGSGIDARVYAEAILSPQGSPV